MTAPAGKAALIIGASRGLGYAIEAQSARGGLQYLDYQGQTVRW